MAVRSFRGTYYVAPLPFGNQPRFEQYDGCSPTGGMATLPPPPSPLPPTPNTHLWSQLCDERGQAVRRLRRHGNGALHALLQRLLSQLDQLGLNLLGFAPVQEGVNKGELPSECEGGALHLK